MRPLSAYEVVALRNSVTAWAPGERYHYSNVGYKLLGLLLERTTGQPYGEVLQQRILEPLGMSASDAVTTHETRRRLAVGYVPYDDDRPEDHRQPLVPATWLEYGLGDGSPACTAADLAAYLRMLLNSGAGPTSRLLSEEAYALLTQQVVATGIGDTFYGYGLMSTTRSDLGGHVTVGHNGGTVGYRAYMLGDRDAGVGVVVLTNGRTDRSAVVTFALQTLLAVREDRALPPVPLRHDPTVIATASDYAGIFGSGPAALRIEAIDQHPILHYKGEELPLEHRRGDDFYTPHPDFALFLLHFGRDETGIVDLGHGAAWYPGEHYRGPTPPLAPGPWAAFVGHYRSYSPWLSNFRVVQRKGTLWFCLMYYGEFPLVPLAEEGTFGWGVEDAPAERLHFDTIIEGQAQRVQWAGGEFYRVATP